MKILAIDDDEFFLTVLTEVLSACGYTDLTVAKSAKEAMTILSAVEVPFDCLLVDIKMPGKDGITLCREIRGLKEYADTPILMLTAMTDTKFVDKAFDAGATDYVNKPLNGLELGARIRVARMLITQARNLAAGSQLVESLENKVKQQASPAAENAIMLNDLPGFKSQVELENVLLKLPSASYAMNIFALKVAETEALVESLSASDFHHVIHGVAEALSERLAAEKTFLTYTGQGVFGCVRIGRSNTLPGGLDGRTGVPTEVEVKIPDGKTVHVRLIKSAAIKPNIFSGVTAVAALSKAVEKVDLRDDDVRLQDRLDRKRLDSKSVRPKRIRIFEFAKSPSPRRDSENENIFASGR